MKRQKTCNYDATVPICAVTHFFCNNHQKTNQQYVSCYQTYLLCLKMPQSLILSKGKTVQNILGSSKGSKGAKSYYEKSECWPDHCTARGCTEEANHGGHVKITDGRHIWAWYIIPVCRGHNKPASNTRFVVQKGTIAVKDERPNFLVHVKSWVHNAKHIFN